MSLHSANFTYTERYPATATSNLYLDGVLIPNPDDDPLNTMVRPGNAFFYPQGLANTTTGPVLLDPYRYTEDAPASVDAVVNGSLVQANLTASGAPAAVSALNGLGLGLGPDGDGDSLGPLWLNGAALQDQDILSAGDLNPDLTLNVAALLPGSSLSGNATLAITNLASQTTLAAGQVTDGAGNYEPVLLLPASLAVDNNRDGTISLDVDDQTSSDRPFRFWLNNNVDRWHTVDVTSSNPDGYQIQDNLNPANYTGNLDYEQDQILGNEDEPGTRDLADFSTMAIDTSGLQQAFAGNTSIYIGFKWKTIADPTTYGHPAIKLFWAYNMNANSSASLNDYVTNSTAAANEWYYADTFENDDSSLGAIKDISGVAINATNITVSGDKANGTLVAETINGNYDFVLPSSVFQYVDSDNPVVYLHFEGCQRGRGELEMVILQGDGTGNFTKIADGPSLSLDLRDIKEMYERWTVGDGPAASGTYGMGGGGSPSATNYWGDISTARLPSGVSAGLQYDNGSWVVDANDPYILFVHGWNLHPWEKDAFAETAYKRLYWQGYTGRFGTFEWPTTYHDSTLNQLESGLASLVDFDQSEDSALQSAYYLENLFEKLNQKYPGKLYVLAHSHGNMVVGQALLSAGQHKQSDIVHTYIATEAAIAGSMWDGNLTSSSPLNFTLSLNTTVKGVAYSSGTFGPDTPNVYDNYFSNTTFGNTTVSAVSAKYNFYNVNDYAFSRLIWQSDQILKPDIRTHPVYGDGVYFYDSTDITTVPSMYTESPFMFSVVLPSPFSDPTIGGPIAEGIIKFHTSIFVTGNVIGPTEILPYDAEPRSLALGQISSSIAGFSGEQNLQSLWPADPYTAGDYSEHPWHSAPFRFDAPDQDEYWNELMKKFGITPNHSTAP